MLSNTDVERIDRAARALLADPGILVEDPEIEALLLAAGGKAGARTGVVRLPDGLIDEQLAVAPAEVRFADRRQGGGFSAAPDGCSSFWTGAALFYLDGSGFREISRQDLADFARVIEALPNVDALVGTATRETPPGHRDFAALRIMAGSTRKHLRALSFSAKGGEAMIEMARVLAGAATLREKPVFSVGFTAHGPLRWTSLALGVYKATSGHGVPATVNGEPMAGASAPVTLAGTAAVGTAEILAGIVINQLLEPGRPCLFNLGFAHVMDMRQAFAVTGGPENALLAVAGAELARHYNLPSVSWMCTDSLGYDGQNALEKMLAAVTHLRARVSTIWGVGQVESEKTICPQQAAIDDEIIGAVRRFYRGFPVNPETLAVEEVRRAGICGNFMDSEHTFAHFRGEVFEPELLVRMQRAAAGRRDTMAVRAEDRVRSILAAPAQPCLGPEEERELLAIEKRYAELI